jgi:hypothetical protein
MTTGKSKDDVFVVRQSYVPLRAAGRSQETEERKGLTAPSLNRSTGFS